MSYLFRQRRTFCCPHQPSDIFACTARRQAAFAHLSTGLCYRDERARASDDTMSANQSPFSIRPIKASGDRRPKTLADFIARVNATHPGGFRALNQADVKRQIEERAKKQHGDADTPDVHMEDGAGSDEEADAEATKDLGAARMEVLRNISYATLSSRFHIID